MKASHKVSIVTLAALLFAVIGTRAAFAATTPSLGEAARYGVLSSTYTNTTVTTINGDVGFTTGPAVAPLGTHANYGSGNPYSTAGSDQGDALSDLNAEGCDFSFGAATDLSLEPQPLAPGVYCVNGAASIGTGGITLNNGGTYIFRIDGALNTAANSSVSLGGASACNVFWTPTGATTLGANSTFMGTVIDDAGITVGANTVWTGRALAFSQTVTTNTAEITVPSCGVPPPPPATLHVIKLVVNGNASSTAVAADFLVSVKDAGVDVSGSPTAGTAAPGTEYSLSAGTYVVSEDPNPLYTQSFSGACDSSGSITLSSGDDETCTIINTDIPPPEPVPPVEPPEESSGGTRSGSTRRRIVPLIGIVKVPTPLALAGESGSVTYNYTVWNVGGQEALVDVTVTDDTCDAPRLLSGDLDNDNKLDPVEKWKYACTARLSRTTTNTAVATGYSNDPEHDAAIATAIATVVVGEPAPSPLIDIIKIPSRLTPFPFGGGDVTYTYIITNPGVVAVRNVVVADDTCSPLSGPVGDSNHDDRLDLKEIWTYTCSTNVPVSTRNVAMVKGTANGFTAIDYAFADVLVAAPGLPNTGFPPVGDNTLNTLLLAGVLMMVVASFAMDLKRHRA